MKQNKQRDDSLQRYFQDRYEETITVLQEYEEHSGEKGTYYRGVCKSERYEEPFVVMLYPDPEAKDTVTIQNRACTVEDEYPNLVFQNEIGKRLEALLDEPVLVRCRLETDRCFTKEETALGADACLRLEGVNPFIRYYILLRPGTDLAAQTEALKWTIREMGLGEQYLFLGTAALSDGDRWKTWYLDHYDNFDYFIEHSEAASDVEMLRVGGPLGGS